MSYYVYIIQNSSGRFYIGQTSNLVSRLQRHNDGKVFWTKSRGPWEMVYNRLFQTRKEAMAEEKRLKSLKSSVELEKIITQR